MSEKKCPDCGAQMPVEMRACPFCPYSFPEEDAADIEQVRQQQTWSPLPIVLMVAAAGGVGWLYATMARGGEDVAVGMADKAKGMGSAIAAAKQAQQQLGGAGLQPAGLDPEATAMLSKLTNAAPPPGAPGYSSQPDAPSQEEEGNGGQAVFIHAADPGKPAAVVKEWKMRGMVYDLVTLAPVPSARLTFRDEQANARFETVADASGRYRMILKPLEGRGYAVSLAREGYAPSYLNPGMEGVRSLPKPKRQELSRELTGAVLSPYELQPAGAEPLVTDFYVAPTR